MSYTRWSDESNVYVYASCDGGIVCAGCGHFKTGADILYHLKEHRLKGHKVPEDVFTRLEQDTRDGEKFGPMERAK